MLTRLDRLSYEQNHQLNDFIPSNYFLFKLKFFELFSFFFLVKESALVHSDHHGFSSSSSDKRKTIQFEEDNN